MVRAVAVSEFRVGRSEPKHLAVVAVALLCALAPYGALSAAPPDPSVRLYDSGSPGPGIPSSGALRGKAGWTRVPANAPGYGFRGVPVLTNDRIAVVLARRGCVAEVHALGAKAHAARAVVRSLRGGDADGDASFRIVENGAGAAEVEVTRRREGGAEAACRIRLTAGEPVVQCRVGRGASSVRLGGRIRRVVVPEFFGDDMVLGPENPPAQRAGLAAENFFLWHDAGGDAMVLCAWDRAGAHADMIPPQRGAGPYLDVACPEGARLWIACLEGAGLWQGERCGKGKTPAAALRAFQPPFPAKWRASFVGAGGQCESVTFEEPPHEAPVPENWRGPVILYPIDRSRATPLTAILPMDVLRSTLGMGPCQYILEAEGLGGDEPAPPEAVVGWIERLAKKKRAARAAEEIKERLDAMLAHLAAARARIDAYAAFGRHVRRLCRQAPKQDAQQGTAAAVLAIGDRLDHDLERGRAAMKTPDDAARLARRVAALVEKPGAAAALETPAGALRAIGRAFDATLARSRMAARRIKAACRTRQSGLARKVETMADRMLGRN